MQTPKETSTINRRAFLKAAGAAIGGLALAQFFPPVGVVRIRAAGMDKLYRGTLSGAILESLDSGRNWQTVVDFGPQIAVLGMSGHGDGLAAWMLHQGRTFMLKSADARTWYTADWQPPA